MIDAEQRVILKQLLVTAKFDVSVDTIIRELTKPKENIRPERLQALYAKLCRYNPIAEQTFRDVETNLKDVDPTALFSSFLDMYQKRGSTGKQEVRQSLNIRPELEKSAVNVKPRSASLSTVDAESTMATQRSLISDVKSRLTAAATSGLSKFARNSAILSNSSESRKSVVNTSNPPNAMDVSLNFSMVSDTSSGLKARRQLWSFHESVQFRPSSALAIPQNAQDQIMIRELLYCLCGSNSGYITRTVEPTGYGLHAFTYIVSEEINCSLREMVGQLLPMGSYYAMIDEFILQQQYIGPKEYQPTANACDQTLQAFAAALRDLLREYLMTLVEIEADAHCLTMAKIRHMLRPAQHSLTTLAETVTFVRKHNLSGARFLSYLHEKIISLTGDESAQELHIFLIEHSSLPFMTMLELWIRKGVIIDPQLEFMISEKFTGDESSYWVNRYSIVEDRIPKFLDLEKDKILRSGKYLNVMQQCGYQMNCDLNQEPLRFSPTSTQHLEHIKIAYEHASRSLLDLFVKDKDMLGHLTSVKRYLLMEQGDFICQFMDTVEDELWKNIDKMYLVKMNSLLGLALRISSAKDDKYKDELGCHIWESGLVKNLMDIHNQPNSSVGGGGGYNNPADIFDVDLMGYESISFAYQVDWPLSLVINKQSLLKYQLVCRMLFYFKHVERVLNRMWIHNKNAKKFERKMDDSLRATVSLRHRMLHTVQNIQYYIMLEVVEPLWQQFLLDLAKVQNVDDVLARHEQFTDNLAKQCMLLNPDLVQIMVRMCKLCIEFSGMVLAETEFMMAKGFDKKVDKYSVEFTAHLLQFLNMIVSQKFDSSSNRLVNLLHRLNFNMYFSDKLDSEAKELPTRE